MKKQIRDYIDYDFHTPNTREVQQFLKMNFELSDRYGEWESTHNFITPTYNKEALYTTNSDWGLFIPTDEFIELIGMEDVPDTSVSTKQQLDELYKTDPVVVRQYLKELATREDNIRKELEFAEAKKARLEKHIDTLKSKLQ